MTVEDLIKQLETYPNDSGKVQEVQRAILKMGGKTQGTSWKATGKALLILLKQQNKYRDG